MPLPLAIVIPTYNRRAFTRDCLDALARQTDPDFLVIVVDDGSRDGTAEMIRTRFPAVLLLEGDGNLWWTAATNLGTQTALDRRAAAVMTLNDDTVPPPDFVARMKQAAAQRPGALIGALAVSHDTGLPVHWGERIAWPTASFIPLPRPPGDRFEGLHEVTHFPGRGLLIPASVFFQIGLFDDRAFRHYAADYDFTVRAARAGHPVLCNYDAPLRIREKESGGTALMRHRSWRHYGEHLTGLKGAGNLRVFVRFALRNCPSPWLLPCLACGLAKRLVGYPAHWLLESLGRRPS